MWERKGTFFFFFKERLKAMVSLIMEELASTKFCVTFFFGVYKSQKGIQMKYFLCYFKVDNTTSSATFFILKIPRFCNNPQSSTSNKAIHSHE